MSAATLGRVLCWAQRRLAGAGIEAAKREARLLVGHAMGIDAAGLIAASHDAPPPGLAARLDPLLRRRAGREPLAHVLGRAEFYGLDLLCDARALVPRSDSEAVVDWALELAGEGPAALADLGTGSGCLLLAALSQRPGLTGAGIDVSADAIALAEANAEATGLAGAARFEAVSWAAWQGWGAADLIMSNPPYIAAGVIETLEPEVRDHDPRGALDGGPDGLSAYRELIALGRARMKPGAWLVLEIGHDQRKAVLDLLAAAGFVQADCRQDLSGHDRVVAARAPFHR
ncbi:MAG: peptide chain release factor N(5)-glutamine methyltransferase [Pseudomonadota bacterium]